jgi:hypothetical protein
MRSRVGRVALLAALTALCVVIFSGCFSFDEFDESYDEDFSDMRESVSEGYFKLTIHTDKDEFAKGETIDCWAELEYIGDADSITVYVSGDPITMDMTGEEVYYSASEFIFKEDTLTLEKGVPVRCTLAEALPKSKSVLPGKYRIDAYTDLSLSPDGAVSYYGCVSAVIVVEE